MGGKSYQIGSDFGWIWYNKDGSSSKTAIEENCALVGKAKKGKGNKSYSKSETSKGGKKRDMSIVKCFHCHEHVHYASNCP